MATIGRVGGAALALLAVFPVLAIAEPRAFGEVEFGVEVSHLLIKHPGARCADEWGPGTPRTTCIVDLIWAEVPVRVAFDFFETGRPARILAEVRLHFSRADGSRIRDALTTEYGGEGRSIIDGDTGKPTGATWWSGQATSAYLSSTSANVTSSEHGRLVERHYSGECERTRALCLP